MKASVLLENCPISKRKIAPEGCSGLLSWTDVRHRDECAFYAPRFYLEHPKAVDDGLVYAVTDHG